MLSVVDGVSLLWKVDISDLLGEDGKSFDRLAKRKKETIERTNRTTSRSLETPTLDDVRHVHLYKLLKSTSCI